MASQGAGAAERGSKTFVAGGETMVGSALLHQLRQQGYTRVMGGPGEEPDLTDAAQVREFFEQAAPDFVFLVGGSSGGIGANQRYPADLMLDNLQVVCSVLEAAHRFGVRKLLYLASSCCYPRHCPQPMSVDHLLTGPLEPTNEAYALAKLAGIKLCQAYRRQYGVDFVTAIPANPFGPGDEFGLEDSHVIPALIRKMHQAKAQGIPFVEVWGTGRAKREFIFVEDLADACIFVMREYDHAEPINLGSGSALSIGELAHLVKEVVGYPGELRFDPSKPDGMPEKVLDSSRLMAMGWHPRTPFRTALAATYTWFLEQLKLGAKGALHV